MVKSLFDMHQEELKDTRRHGREQENIRLKGEIDKEVAGIKESNKAEKPVNMDPNYDAVGTQVLGAEYHTLQGQRKFAELYKNDPNVRKLVDDKIARDAKNKFQGFAPIFNLAPTAGGLQPYNVRTGQTVGAPVADRPLTGEQINTQQQIGTLKDTLDRVKTLMQYDDEKGIGKTGWVGPVSGRAAGLQENYVGGLASEQSQAYADLASMENQLVYLYSGKQINENEFKRLKKALPDKNLPVSTFNSRMKSFDETYNSIIKNRAVGLAAGGHSVPQTGGTNTPSPAPKQSGNQPTAPKTIRYNAQGQRVE
jgi:hypothetical protein